MLDSLFDLMKIAPVLLCSVMMVTAINLCIFHTLTSTNESLSISATEKQYEPQNAILQTLFPAITYFIINSLPEATL